MQAKRIKGFTLIEVLAAILVLTVGVLGAAGLQLAALQARQGTGLTSSGVQLAGSLAERMRANARQMRAGDAGNPYLHDYDALTDGPPAPPGVLCFAGADCDSAQMAAFDVYEISQALHAGFPGARISVCRDAAVVPRGGDTLAWQCSGGADAPIVIKLGWRARSAQAGGDSRFAPSIAIVAAGAFP